MERHYSNQRLVRDLLDLMERLEGVLDTSIRIASKRVVHR
jgi:hypothetical protein